jgi:hypothetical protein
MVKDLNLLCSHLLPSTKSSEQVKEKNSYGDHGRLDTERKNAGGHSGLQVDIDCHDHLSKEDEATDEQDLIFAFCGQRSPKPRQQEENARNHLRQFARQILPRGVGDSVESGYQTIHGMVGKI